jgi:hypothetical protein
LTDRGGRRDEPPLARFRLVPTFVLVVRDGGGEMQMISALLLGVKAAGISLSYAPIYGRLASLPAYLVCMEMLFTFTG